VTIVFGSGNTATLQVTWNSRVTDTLSTARAISIPVIWAAEQAPKVRDPAKARLANGRPGNPVMQAGRSPGKRGFAGCPQLQVSCAQDSILDSHSGSLDADADPNA